MDHPSGETTSIRSEGNADRFESAASLDLVSQIRAGSIESWHRFIRERSPIILRVVRRYLAALPADDQRSLYVRILEGLYQGDLYAYEGRARLSTWLFVYTRSRCLDHLRHEHGRRRLPAWLRGLPAIDREVYRLYYRSGLRASEVCECLSRDGVTFTFADLAASIDRLDGHVDDGVRRRTAFELQARSIGFTSGRLLEYLHRLKIEMEVAAEDQRPDQQLFEKETRRLLVIMRAFLDRLPEIERQVIALRFYERRTANETAAELQVPARRIYTLEERALRHLRRMFDE